MTETPRRRRRIRAARAWRWTLLALAIALVVPSAAAAQGRFVYVSDGFPAGNNDIHGYRINANGTLSSIGSFDMPTMTGSEGLAMTPDAENVYVANYGTDRISGFNVNATTGALTATSGSPYGTGTQADAVLGVTPDPDGGHLFAYNHNATPPSVGTWTIAGNGALSIVGTPNSDPAGNQDPFAGSVAPDGDHLYVPMENITAPAGPQDQTSYFSVGANGSLSFIAEVNTGGPLAADGNPFGSGMLPNGQCLYVSAPEDLATVGRVYGFSILANGSPVVAPGSPYTLNGGSHPLTIAAAPDSEHIYVATRQSDSVNAFNVNADCSLTTTPGSPFGTGGDNGKSLALTPDGSRLYVVNQMSDNISGFNVNPTTGALTLIGAPTPLPAAADPDLEGIAITPNQPPQAAFSPTTLAPAGQASSFDASNSADGDGGTVARYDWDFGDGSTLPDGGPNPQHTYANPGTYTVTLTVTDNENCSGARVFTGKATLCNGNGGATISQQVTIQQAQPQQQAQCVVPDVVGKKKKKAKAAIAAANCTVGTTKKKQSSKVKKKKVIKQEPPAGTVLPAGSPVDLKVSKGKG